MPLFDFHCRTCGHDFEALVRPQDTAACPACKGSDLEKLLSSFAVSSSERSRAAADSAIKKAAKIGTRERIESDKEIERHRKEDH